MIHWDGEYLEVSEPEKLSFTVSDQPGEDVYDLCTVELTDLHVSTLAVESHEYVTLPV